jgi:hypothetical protein
MESVGQKNDNIFAAGTRIGFFFDEFSLFAVTASVQRTFLKSVFKSS